MRKKKVAVIGGGASGIAAAITAARGGAKVTVFERNDRIGKKILATGNGKCNLSNYNMSPECFHTSDKQKLKDCLNRFGAEDAVHFFEELGLMVKDRNGYLYPACEQAAVVLDVLRICVARSQITLKTEAKVTEVRTVTGEEQSKSGRFAVRYSSPVDAAATGKAVGSSVEKFDKVILACGSKAAPKTGSDGIGYELARSFGHHLIPVVPSLVQLTCSDAFCKALAGIRAESCVHIWENGREICRETGEVQLTDYGISGIPVFQLSAQVCRRFLDNKHGELTAVIDFVPGYDDKHWQKLMQERIQSRIGDRQQGEKSSHSGITVEEFFTGMLNKKLMMVLIKQAGLNPTAFAGSVPVHQLKKVFALCKGLTYRITGHNGFENAQVCSGGVDMREVTENLESRIVPGLFFAGELLDVDGRCGGYNLQWAWTSGVIAGRGVWND